MITLGNMKELEENITPSSIGGMGAVLLPTATQDGSGDIPSGRGDATKEYKKKKKKMKKILTFESYVNEAKSTSAKKLLTQVSKGNTSEIEGTKFSKEMADEILNWMDSSTYARKYKEVQNASMGSLSGIVFSDAWGIKKRLSKNLKSEFNTLKDVFKKEVEESVVNEAVSKATKIYQIASPAPKKMLVEELENLFGDDYRHIVTEFDDNEGYESVIVFNLSKSDIKKIEDNIGDVLIWEYSIKKGKEITESVSNELVNESFSSFLFNSPNEFGEFMNSAPDKGETKYLVFAHNKVNFNGQEIKLSGGYGIGSATSKSILGIFDNEQSAKDAYKAAMKKPEGNFVSFTMGTLLALTKFRSQYTEIEGHLAKIKLK